MMRRRRTIGARRLMTAAAVLALAAGGCSDATGPGARTGEQLALARARSRWNARAHDDYAYTLVRSCFCVQEVTRPIRVRVHDGAVASATYVDTGEPVPAQYASMVLTAEGLLALVQDALRRAAAVEVTYDAQFGYPRTVAVDYNARTADDELFLSASDLTLGATR